MRPYQNLLRGLSKSCGCAQRTQDGHSHDPEFIIWRNMRSRCQDPKDKSYPRYGGRGITVSPRWADFQVFRADVGPRPSPQHSLDRIDNSRGYEPENVRWATPVQQANNTRANRNLTFDGRTQTVTQWAREVGLSAGTIHRRLELGWSVERAVTQPARRQRNNSAQTVSVAHVSNECPRCGTPFSIVKGRPGRTRRICKPCTAARQRRWERARRHSPLPVTPSPTETS